MEIDLKVDAERVIAKLVEAKARIPQRVNQVLHALTLKLQARAVARAPLKTGKLRRSIFSEVTATNAEVVGRVFVSSDTPYAKIQEYGGKTAAHDIIPSKAKALAFAVGGKQIVTKRVHHPGSNIPAKNYLHGAFEEMKPEIIAKLKDALRGR